MLHVTESTTQQMARMIGESIRWGYFFGITFRKRSGDVRSMVCRATESGIDWDRGLIRVTVPGLGIRSFRIESILSIRALGRQAAAQ